MRATIALTYHMQMRCMLWSHLLLGVTLPVVHHLLIEVVLVGALLPLLAFSSLASLLASLPTLCGLACTKPNGRVVGSSRRSRIRVPENGQTVA